MTSLDIGIVLQKHTKMIQHHVHIRSTDQIKKVRVHERK